MVMAQLRFAMTVKKIARETKPVRKRPPPASSAGETRTGLSKHKRFMSARTAIGELAAQGEKFIQRP
jgi:hypothetical protein